MHDLNNSPFAWVFDNVELYLYIACKSNYVSTNVTQPRQNVKMSNVFL